MEMVKTTHKLHGNALILAVDQRQLLPPVFTQRQGTVVKAAKNNCSALLELPMDLGSKLGIPKMGQEIRCKQFAFHADIPQKSMIIHDSICGETACC